MRRMRASCAAPSSNGREYRSRSGSRRPRRSRRSRTGLPRKTRQPEAVSVFLLRRSASQREALGRLELTDLWGIAGRMAERLRAIGITTPLELRDADASHGARALQRRHRAHGARTAGRRLYRPRRSFARPQEPDRLAIVRAGCRNTGRGSKRRFRFTRPARRKRCAGKTWRRRALPSGFKTNSFKPNEKQYSASKAVRLPVATADSGKLIAAATAGLRIIFKPGYRYKKAGVTFLDLVTADCVQGGLFDRPGRCALDPAACARSISSTRASGAETVGFGTAGERQSWGLRREFISPRYTTMWDELLRV